MALDQNALNRIMGAARARNVSQVEELWVDLLHAGGVAENLRALVKVIEEVARRGDSERAADLLVHPTLRTALKEAGKLDDLFEVLRKAVSLSKRVKGIRHDLLEQYRRRYADREGLEAVISRTDLAGEGPLDEGVRQLDEAFYFQKGDYVFHEKGWGIGRVVEARPESGELVIDFKERRGQRMEAGMALRALQQRPADDLDVLLWTDPDRVVTLAEEDPLALLRKGLAVWDGKLQSKVLRDKLGDVLGKSGWTKFWGRARKAAKDDPTMELGGGARSTVSLRDEPVSREDEVSEQIRKLRSFRDRLQVARRELVAIKKDAAGDPPAWLEEALKALGTNHGKAGTPPQRAARLELALFQSEVAEVWPQAVPEVQAAPTGEDAVDPETGEPLPEALPEHLAGALRGLVGAEMPEVLREISTPEYRRRVIRLVAAGDLGEAVQTLIEIVLDPAPQSWDEAVKALKELGRDDAIVEAVKKILISPRNHPQALAAFARARLTGSLDMLPDRTDAELMIKVLKVFDSVNMAFKTTGNRKEKAHLKPSVEALRAVISEKNQRSIGKVIAAGTEGDVRRVLQLVRQSPTLTGTIRRSTEKFVAKRFPELLATVATNVRPEEEEQDTSLYSTAAGVRKREKELNEIVSEKLEAVRLEIGRALEFGDVSENAELDAAREMQQRLGEQATRMRDELTRVVLIDPSKIDTDSVRVGSRVTVENAETGEQETYSLLGPWDLDDADQSIISYMSALARGLIGSKEGETATVELPGNRTATYKVLSIGRAITEGAARDH
ncbi:MAG: GreA/GreB family elongation factor [Planctomycetota bacterium]